MLFIIKNCSQYKLKYIPISDIIISAIKNSEVLIIKNFKTKWKLYAAMLCAVLVIIAACLYIYRMQSVADIVSFNRAELTWISVSKVLPGEGAEQIFASSEKRDAEYVVNLFSNLSVRFVERNVNHFFREEDNGYYFMIMETDGTDYIISYDNGYIYCKDNKYKVLAEDIEPFINGLKTICSD